MVFFGEDLTVIGQRGVEEEVAAWEVFMPAPHAHEHGFVDDFLCFAVFLEREEFALVKHKVGVVCFFSHDVSGLFLFSHCWLEPIAGPPA